MLYSYILKCMEFYVEILYDLILEIWCIRKRKEEREGKDEEEEDEEGIDT